MAWEMAVENMQAKIICSLIIVALLAANLAISVIIPIMNKLKLFGSTLNLALSLLFLIIASFAFLKPKTIDKSVNSYRELLDLCKKDNCHLRNLLRVLAYIVQVIGRIGHLVYVCLSKDRDNTLLFDFSCFPIIAEVGSYLFEILKKSNQEARAGANASEVNNAALREQQQINEEVNDATLGPHQQINMEAEPLVILVNAQVPPVANAPLIPHAPNAEDFDEIVEHVGGAQQ